MPQLARQEPQPSPSTDVSPPQREAVGMPTPAAEIPAVASSAAASDKSPEIARAPQEAPTTPAATVPAAPSAEPIARADAGPTMTAATRQPVIRSPIDGTAATSIPSRGSAQRLAPELDDLTLAAPLPIDDAPALARPVGLTSNEIVRQASPVATPGDDTHAGTATAAEVTADLPRFTRSASSRSPTLDAAPGAAVEPFRPNFDPVRDRVASAASRALPNTLESDPQPSVIRPATTSSGGLALPPAATTYRLRSIDRRQDVALKHGGTESSERAVEEALRWLAKHQEPDGFWDADKHGGGAREVRPIEKGRPPGGDATDTGVTGLAILAFLGAGYTHEEGEYEETVSQAIHWLIAQQRSDGYLGGRATYYDQMYCHGIATYALAEAFGMQANAARFPELKEAVAQGVWYIIQTQNSDGGWRYRTGASPSDVSMFGWQLMAIKSAELAGLEVPAETRQGMIKFLRERSRGDRNGLAGYKDTDPPSPAMTAEALFCKQMYGLKRSSPSSREATDYLQMHLPRMSSPDEYYWYYGTLAMFQYGGEPWQRWNQSLRDTLIRLQRKNGDHAGSWDPAGQWGSVGGRVYSTTLCVLSLEVYYRFLPLYRVVDE
jgi:hypothetical protein